VCASILVLVIRHAKRRRHIVICGNFYGSHSFVFVTKQAKPIQYNTTHVCFDSECYIYIRATCFGLYLGHPQACRPYKGRYNKYLKCPCSRLLLFIFTTWDIKYTSIRQIIFTMYVYNFLLD